MGYPMTVVLPTKPKLVCSDLFSSLLELYHGCVFDWTMFAAGASSDTTVRDTLVTLVHAKVGSNTSAGIFPLSYDPSNGSTISGRARYIAPIFAKPRH
ncbi:hypothetical protein EV421DRAFT_1884652 [Armillaria borealis]|uniref:Uncharacterized protein n=1 Tax=Armillaria borealis TaxID=47425 RepID=A0AA39IDZ9_9AGAR|nr:hypothetical protein EV421DRAFT_1884652 [Armillaria borealis]